MSNRESNKKNNKKNIEGKKFSEVKARNAIE